MDDFADEVAASEVFNPFTKKMACNLTIIHARLAVVLTNVLAVIYPPSGLWKISTFNSEIQIHKTLDALSRANEALDMWRRTYLPYLEALPQDIHPAVAAQSAIIVLCYK
jgi:hypothetical protein